MSKKNIILITLLSVVGVVLFAIILRLILLAVIFLMPSAPDETFICSSVSPNNTITLQAYQIGGGATVDYSVKVYVVNGEKRNLIFNSYHDMDADIQWINDNVVCINEIELDLSKNQTYDWRKGIKENR